MLTYKLSTPWESSTPTNPAIWQPTLINFRVASQSYQQHHFHASRSLRLTLSSDLHFHLNFTLTFSPLKPRFPSFFFGQSVLEIERGENCLRPLLTHKTRSDYVMFRNWSRCHGARFLCFCFGLCHNHALYDFLPPEKTKKMPISVFGPATEFPSVVLCKEPCAALLWGHENFWEMFPLRFETTNGFMSSFRLTIIKQQHWVAIHVEQASEAKNQRLGNIISRDCGNDRCTQWRENQL